MTTFFQYILCLCMIFACLCVCACVCVCICVRVLFFVALPFVSTFWKETFSVLFLSFFDFFCSYFIFFFGTRLCVAVVFCSQCRLQKQQRKKNSLRKKSINIPKNLFFHHVLCFQCTENVSFVCGFSSFCIVPHNMSNLFGKCEEKKNKKKKQNKTKKSKSYLTCQFQSDNCQRQKCPWINLAGMAPE